ncbi:MAG: SDR family oxidoreductase [Actinobacteria bacterium]|nr:SDR family oxidoreductase [Actinomycetota bacterium]
MTVLVTGASSTIARETLRIVQERRPGEEVVRLGRSPGCAPVVDLRSMDQIDALADDVLQADRLLVCHGLLHAKDFLAQSPGEVIDSLTVNLLSTVRLVERALSVNPDLRAVVLGSESGFKGSFDGSYALAKAGLHAYVRRRRLSPRQQLVCVAPSVIGDAGMTTRRVDQDRVRERAATHPMGRLASSAEIAEFIYYLLYLDQGYINNAVIPVDGGKFA